MVLIIMFVTLVIILKGDIGDFSKLQIVHIGVLWGIITTIVDIHFQKFIEWIISNRQNNT
jgi:hypothetical protein